MKKIGIDARLYFQTGVGVYLRNFIHYLQEASSPFQFYVYVMKEDSLRIDFKGKNFIKREVTAKWHSLSEQLTFYNDLMADNLDLMHFTYFSYPVLYRKKFIATVHDVTPLLFKTGQASTKNEIVFNFKHKVLKFVIANQVHNAKTIITPTQTVKDQLVKMYGTGVSEKIVPIHEGVNYELLHSKEYFSLAKKFDKPFFIYVGNFYPHKNVERLVEAFNTIEKAQLIMIGPENYFSKRLKAKIKNPNIIFHHNVKNEELVFFYKHALALINPSLSEGFGLPVVEAVHFNLPVIASNLNVFNELLGKHYLSFDPTSTQDMAIKIEYFLTKKLQFEYKEIIRNYSFEKMTELTLDEYKKVLV